MNPQPGEPANSSAHQPIPLRLALTLSHQRVASRIANVEWNDCRPTLITFHPTVWDLSDRLLDALFAALEHHAISYCIAVPFSYSHHP